MTAKKEEQQAALPIVAEETYVFLDPALDMAGLILDNLGNEPLDRFSLTTIHVPTGGSTTWVIPGLRGEEETKELTGVIVAFNREKAYWKQPFGSDTGAPPDCKAPDAQVGMGDPGGPCLKCPNNQFDTKPLTGGGLGTGKACRDQVVLLLMREKTHLPICVIVPPTSINNFKTYRTNLVQEAYSRAQAVTKMTLVKVQNKTGIPYGEINFELVGLIRDDRVPTVKQFTAMFEPAMKGALPAPAEKPQITE
jgi:hypothetical protein